MINVEEIWSRVRAQLRAEVGDKTYERCLEPLSLVDATNQRVVLGMTTRFMGDFVMTHFSDQLLRLFRKEEPGIVAVEVTVTDGNGKVGHRPFVAEDVPVRAPQPSLAETANSGNARASHLPHEQAAPQSANGLNPVYTFETFVVGKSNALAHAAAQRVAAGGTPVYNPLYIYGASGLGKTHLMHAIGNAIMHNDPNRRVRYVSAENFLNLFVSALRYKDTLSFKNAFRNVDVLMVDDVQFMVGKDTTQEEFFHTFNALVENNRQVIVSADCSPNDLDGIEDRIRSRLGWGMTVDIQQTDYELRLGILQMKADGIRNGQIGRGVACPVHIPEDVLAFLAERITSNVRDLEGALIRIIAHAELVGAPITIESTRLALKDLLRASERQITIDEIMLATAEASGLRVQDLKSERRSQSLVRARHIAMWLAKELTQRSYPQIAHKFGGRDHTTVLHAVRKIDRQRAADANLAEELERLVRRIRG